MSKSVKKVRKSIENRKKSRGIQWPSNTGIPMHIQDVEEKHGYPPEITGFTLKRREAKPFLMGLLYKAILASILFFSVAILMDSKYDALTHSKEVVAGFLNTDFPFAKVNVWYQDVFGSPLAIPYNTNFNNTQEYGAAFPVNGQVTESFQVNGKGVKIAPGKETEVYAHQPGVVLFAGNDWETAKTIIIQHADGTDSTYGFLNELEVHHYQYVNANQRIGSFIPEEGKEAIYFSLEKDNSYLDPIQVIEVDDAN